MNIKHHSLSKWHLIPHFKTYVQTQIIDQIDQVLDTIRLSDTYDGILPNSYLHNRFPKQRGWCSYTLPFLNFLYVLMLATT